MCYVLDCEELSLNLIVLNVFFLKGEKVITLVLSFFVGGKEKRYRLVHPYKRMFRANEPLDQSNLIKRCRLAGKC